MFLWYLTAAKLFLKFLLVKKATLNAKERLSLYADIVRE